MFTALLYKLNVMTKFLRNEVEQKFLTPKIIFQKQKIFSKGGINEYCSNEAKFQCTRRWN